MNPLKKSITTKVVSGFVGFAMVTSFVFGGAIAPAQAQTVDDLTAQIASLLATITSLQNQLATMQGGSTSAPTSGFTFTRNLSVGDTGNDVMELQKILNQDPTTQVAVSGVGSPGNETSYFGSLTKAAVINFQNVYSSEILAPVGLNAGTGYVGPSTRAKLNSMSTVVVTPPTTNPGTGTGTGTGTTQTGLTVSAASQPANGIAPQGASRVPFTKITLTAGSGGSVTVNNITVERTGFANDGVFAGVVLIDENGQQIGIQKTLNSNHQTTVGEPFTIAAGTSKTVTIAGNMAASLGSFAGQVAALSVVGINTSATVSGSLPITGAAHTINASLTIGTASVTVDPITSSTKEIGTTGYIFGGFRITGGSSEAVRLHSIRLNQTGSAGPSDLGNVQVVVDGVAYPATVSDDGKYYTATFGGGIVIDKGFSKEIDIKADIVGGNAAGRTVIFDINRNTDVYLTGETYGYGITIPAGAGTASDLTSAFTAGTPWFDGAAVTVQAGTITTIGKSNSVPAQNIAINVPNQPLGGFEIDVKGEALSVQTMTFSVATTGGSAILENVTIVDANGAVVAGPVDASSAGSQIVFSDTVTFPVGKNVYTVRGKVPSTGTNGTTITLSTNPSSGWTNVTGQTSGNTLSLSNGNFEMNQMTVKGAALSISIGNTPAAQTIVAGAQDVLFANIQLDATASGEDVRFSSIPLELTFGGYSAKSHLSGCQIMDGSTLLNSSSNVVNPNDSSAATTSAISYTFTLDNSLTVSKGTVKTLPVTCDTSGSASGTFAWGIDAAPAISVTGVTSGNSVSETVSASVGQTMTIGAGSFTVAKDSSSPSYTVVSAGTSNVTLGVLKLRATNEDLTLKKIGLQLTNTASSSASNLLGGQVTIWDGNTQIGTAVFTGSSYHATSTLSTNVVLPKNTDKKLTLKGTLTDIGTSQPGTQGALLQVDWDGGDPTATEAVGDGSGTVYASGSDTAVDGVRIFRSFPVFAKDTLPVNGVADGRLLRFKVTADASGDVGIAKFTVTLSTTSANVSTVNIFGFSDSSYSNAISGVSTGGQLMASNVTPVGPTGAAVAEVYAQTSGAAQTAIQIPAGETRYFEVRAFGLAGTGTSYSVTTTLDGDSAYPGSMTMGTLTAVDADANDDFIWSPNATGESATGTADWTNGFSLSGLPTNGLIETRTN
ncbi:MAG: peptidoglycan-binding domain-containing protein [Candidatus Paceibacterota bacterium]